MHKQVAIGLLCAALGAVGGEIVVMPGGLSPQEALENIRAAKAQGDVSAWTVRVKAGRYPLAKTLVFTPADSGTPQAPVTWVGEDGAEFSGGTTLTGWCDQGDGVWAASIPKTPDGAPAYFEQLWVNGRRADRACFPNAGEPPLRLTASKIEKAKTDGVHTGTPATDAKTTEERFVETVTFSDVKVKAMLAALAPEDLPYVKMGVAIKWSSCWRILRGVDAQSGTVTTWSSEPWRPYKYWVPNDTLLWFENARPAFDAPGEWFYDAKAGKVLYRPLPGEDMAKADVVAPTARLSRIVEFRGDPDAGAFVHDVFFRTIAFAHSAPVGGLNSPHESKLRQAAVLDDGTIALEGVRRVAFERCAVRHTGNYGIRFNNGCTSNRVTRCMLGDLGAGGVWIGADRGYVPKGETLSRRVIRKLVPRSTAFNVVEDCTIRAGGRVNREGTGVVIGHASDCVVRHCAISDFYYTGVSVGWTWGFMGSVAQRNEIAFNHISDIGKNMMSDLAGVYTLSTSYGTTVHDNVIHDIDASSYGGWGLYTDEGSEGIVMERNVVWNTEDGGFHQHFGSGCIIRNNIFAWNSNRANLVYWGKRLTGAIRMERDVVQGVPCTLHFVNNIVLVREGPLTSYGVYDVGGVWANNLWWDVTGTATFNGEHDDWAKWVAHGKETGGVYADPQFESAEAFDFRLKSTSPALKLGFKPWDMSTAGVRK